MHHIHKNTLENHWLWINENFHTYINTPFNVYNRTYILTNFEMLVYVQFEIFKGGLLRKSVPKNTGIWANIRNLWVINAIMSLILYMQARALVHSIKLIYKGINARKLFIIFIHLTVST